MNIEIDLNYCYKSCSKGKAASEEFLNKNNSAFSAAIDFNYFVKECFKNCPYKDEHKKETER